MKQVAFFVCAFAVLFQLSSGAYVESDSSYYDVRVDVEPIVNLLEETQISLKEFLAICLNWFQTQMEVVNESEALKNNQEIGEKIQNMYQTKFDEVYGEAAAMDSSEIDTEGVVLMMRDATDQLIDEISSFGLEGEEKDAAKELISDYEAGFTGVQETLDQISQDQ